MVDYKTAYQQSLEYFGGNVLSTEVFLSKYALTTSEGDVLEPTPTHMFKRLAKEFARTEKKYPNPISEQEILECFDKFQRIIPGGSVLTAVGNKTQKISASNCCAIESPTDDIGGIFDTAKTIAQLTKRRMGIGVCLDTLRPEGMIVNNAAKTTSGAWSFAGLYSNVLETIGQNGRRAALLLCLSVHHPDVEKFITMKQDLKKVTKANISILLTDEFMNAVINDREYEQRWPLKGVAKVSRQVKARNVWKTLTNSAWKTAEPGCLYIDTIKKNLPADFYPEFETISPNACSEIPLSKNDACRLFALNLTNYVDKPFDGSSSFNQEEFKRDIHIAMKLIDDLVDIELEQIKDIMDVCEEGHEKELWKKLCSSGVNGRRTGLGCLGLADCLAQLNLVYGSPEGIDKIDEIYKTLRDVAYETSIQLGKERGTFPVFDWNKEKDCEFIKRLPTNIQKQNKEFGRRNISILTQAPTGTIALLAKTGKQFNTFGVSSGMEPVFRNTYTRRRKINAEDNKSKVDFVDTNGERWQEYEVSHSNVQNYVEKFGKTKQLPKYFITSDEIDWAQRVKVQSVITSYLDHSCSSTINLPKGTSEDVIEKVYLESWKQQNKGVTVYVDGCRDGVLITSSTKTKQPNTRLSLPRPKELPCDIFHTTVQGEKWTIFVGVLNGKPYEAIGGLSSKISMPKRVKSGKILKHNGAENPVARYDLHYDYETDPEDETIIRDIANIFDNKTHAAFTRMISLSLRHEIPIQFLVEQLEKGADKDDEDIYGFSRVMGRVLKKYVKDGTKSSKICPNCNQESIVYKEGCMQCTNCGYSKCG